MVGGTRNTPTSRPARSDRAGGGGRPVGQRHRRAVPDQSQNGELVASALCPTGCGEPVGDRPRSRAQTRVRGGQNQSLGGCDLANQAPRDDAVELPAHGETPRVSKSTVSNIWRSHNLK